MIRLPNNWSPRLYQRPVWDYLEKGGLRAIEIAHRRWGKDDVALHRTAIAMIERPAQYWHCLPEFAQGRKAIWAAVNPHTGKRRIDEAFPPELRENQNDNEMFMRLKNGSTWQVVGSDNYNNLVGAGLGGVVFSEWALANPSAWGYMRPMVEESRGWAFFITTPRGNNHAKSTFDMAKANPKWFSELSNIHHTKALTQDQLDESLLEYQTIYGVDFGLAYFEQEYLCSFSGAMVGAIFGGEINRAEREGRIRAVPVDTKHPVHTAWDLGKAVNNPIWCFQVIDGMPRIVDFYRPESDDIEQWVLWLEARGYKGTDYVPHDAATGFDWGSKRTRIETMRLLKRNPKVIVRAPIQDGINAGNQTIRLAVFDAERCAVGIDGLKNYRREWDDELKTFRENPVKDWSEHIGSAWRYLALAWREEIKAVPKIIKPKELEYVGQADGSIIGNMDVKAAVAAMVRRRRGEE